MAEAGLEPSRSDHAPERAIRDAYAARLTDFRPTERLWRTEYTYRPSMLRADMRTVDELNRVRIWEFKIKAGFDGLGQILTYVALTRQELDFARPVLGVLAAFEIPDEICKTIEVQNLGIETVLLPDTLRFAGAAPVAGEAAPVPLIPMVTELNIDSLERNDQ